MYRAIVVDDEPAAVGKLSDLLRDSELIAVVDGYTNPLEALDRITTESYDVVFLDIDMPGMDGITLANRILDIAAHVRIVFVTAYNQYAIEAFELHALDYLLKPVTKDRLKKTLARVQNIPKQTGGVRESRLKVHCFGKLRVELEDGSYVKWRTKKTEELFAYLLDQNGAWVGKEKFLDLLWGNFLKPQGLTNLYTCIYQLRKTLSDIGRPSLLVNENGMFRLDMEQIESDLQLYEQCTSVTKLDENNRPEYERMVELAVTGYFEWNYYDWTEMKRKHLMEDCLRKIMQLAVYYESISREKAAVAILQRGLELDYFYTDIHLLLLNYYVGRKDRIAAYRHYDEYKRRLYDEFGMLPDHAIENIIGRLGRHDGTDA